MPARFGYFLQGSFYWVATYHYEQNEAIFINIELCNADTNTLARINITLYDKTFENLFEGEF